MDRIGVPGGGLVVSAEGRGPATRSAVMSVISDTGVRFDVPDDETANILGLGGDVVPVDAGILARLPLGPRLDRSSALVTGDGVDLAPVGER